MFSARTLAVAIVSCALGAFGARLLPVSAAEPQQPSASPISIKTAPDGSVTLVNNTSARFLVVQGIPKPGQSAIIRTASKQIVLPNGGRDAMLVRYTERFVIKDGALHPCGPDGHCPPDPPCDPSDPNCPIPYASIRVFDLLRLVK